MKKAFILAVSFSALATLPHPLAAQTSPSGIIHYEGMRKIDPSQIRIVRDGDVVQPGGPDAPEIPDVVSFKQKLLFTGVFAREERENPGPVIRRLEMGPGGGGPPTERPLKVEPPFTESIYLDLKENKLVEVVAIRKDSVTTTYKSEEPLRTTTNWQKGNKTKKIAGYTCQKATSTHKGEVYTIWYTTELPFTYSPIRALLPEKGVVLEVEGSNESFKATKVEMKAIPENEVTPTSNARLITATQLTDIRNKAWADFRSRMFSAPFPDR